jgi:hypothetical protein
MTTPEVTQLVDEVSTRALDLGALLGADLIAPLTRRVSDRAEALTAALCSDDPHEAADTGRQVVGVLWPTGIPDDWWRTPLGRAVARAVADLADVTPLTRARAATVLGVRPGTVAQLTARNTLPRDGDGRIPRGAVLRRLVRD